MVGCKGGQDYYAPDSKDYSTWVGCTACVRVCMLFRFSQEVLKSTLIIVSYKTMLKKVLQVKLHVFK